MPPFLRLYRVVFLSILHALLLFSLPSTALSLAPDPSSPPYDTLSYNADAPPVAELPQDSVSPARVYISPFAYLPDTIPAFPKSVSDLSAVAFSSSDPPESPDPPLHPLDQATLNRLQELHTFSPRSIIELGLADGLRSLDHTQVERYATVRNTFLNSKYFAHTSELISSWEKLGQEAYRRLDSVDAANSFRQAIDLAKGTNRQFLSPEKYASLLLQKALATVEIDPQKVDQDQITQTFREMLYFDPSISLVEGLYPNRTVRLYQGARATLERQLQTSPVLDFVALEASLAQADFMVSAALFEEGDQWVLVAHLWDVRNQQSVSRETIRFQNLSPITLYAHAEKLAARFSPCLVPQVAEPTEAIIASKGTSSFALSVRFALNYFLMMPGPKWLRPYPHLGVAIDALWYIYPEFSLVAGFQILASTSEYSGLLVENYASVRGLIGFDFGVDLWRFRLGTAILLELSKMGSITMCYSTDYRQISSGCSSDRRTFDPPVVLGINLQPHIGFQIVDALELRAASTLGYFFYPFGTNTLNIPISFEIGMLYRF